MSIVMRWLREQPLTTIGFLVQRQVKNPDMREACASALVALRPRKPSQASEAQERLQTQGYAPVNVVGPAEVAEMRAYFERFQVEDPYGRTPGRFWPSDAGPETHVGHFDDRTILHAPHVLRIANDPEIISAVSGALGARPIISSLIAWWSIPHAGQAREAELFHRDVDDWRFIKLFVYLTDVDAGAGPHVYVPGSHCSGKLRTIRRYSDEEVAEAYPGQILTLTGNAGTAFLENTQGLHRGIPPRERPRLLFQVIYSLSKSPYGPRRPLASRADFPALDLDPYMNQVYLD